MGPWRDGLVGSWGHGEMGRWVDLHFIVMTSLSLPLEHLTPTAPPGSRPRGTRADLEFARPQR